MSDDVLAAGETTSMGAASADVEAVLLRPLSPTETPYIEALLGRAWRLLDGAARQAGTTLEALNRELVVDVQAGMVARVLRNPEGVRSESDGQYSYSLNTGVASGRLDVTDEEKALLGITAPSWWVFMPQYGAVQGAGGEEE